MLQFNEFNTFIGQVISVDLQSSSMLVLSLMKPFYGKTYALPLPKGRKALKGSTICLSQHDNEIKFDKVLSNYKKDV